MSIPKVRLTLVIPVTAFWLVARIGVAQPVNDAFAQAIALTGLPAQASLSNAGATREPGEPLHAGNSGGRSVWWTWTSPVAGRVVMHTGGSSLDTLLAVYRGTDVAGLALVAANDDDPLGIEIETSRVWFEASLGTNYAIAVDGYAGASGTIHLQLMEPPRPPNDRFNARITLTGTNVQATGTNVDASRESLEPWHDGLSGARSVWWRWLAPADGVAAVSTLGSDFDTVLAVYAGGALGNLVVVAANDQSPAGGDTSDVRFSVAAGQEYAIAVDGYSNAEGQIVLSLAQHPPPRLTIQSTAAPLLLLHLTGPTGGKHQLESTPTPWLAGTWTSRLTNASLPSGGWWITNPPGHTLDHQFYRAVLEP